jgi:hypothetical protein
MTTSATVPTVGTTGPRRRPRPADPRVIWAVAALAAAVAAFAGASPTGIGVMDVVWTAAFAALVTLAASRARRWPWLLLSGIAAAGAIGSPWVVAGGTALILSIAGAWFDRRNRLLGAVIGALAVQALVRLPDIGFHGLPSLLAALAVAPLLWSAYDRSSRRDQALMKKVAWIAGAVIGVLLLGMALALVAARTELERGVSGARNGLELIRDGEPEQAGDRFVSAAAAFDSAQDGLSALWARPSRLLPLVNQQMDALVGVSESGEDLALTAADATSTGRYQDLRAAAGQIDLELVRSMREPVAASAEALRRADADVDGLRSPWLVPPIAGRLDSFADQIDRALPEAELATAGLEVAPQLLGGEGRRSYLLLFTSPAETRFLGGFVGSYGVLVADNGKVSLEESGPISELSYARLENERTLDGFDEVLTRYGRYNPTLFFQNLSVSPDFPTDAAMAGALFPQATGQTIDGVLVADPFAMAALLELTGPVAVEGLDEPLTSENAANYLLRDQYLQFSESDEIDERRDKLSVAARATFDALTERELPGPRALGAALGPVMHQNRLLFWTFDSTEQRFLDQLGTTGRFQPDPANDYLSVRTANANPNKIDSFLERSIDYDVVYDPSNGMFDAEVSVRLTNNAPASGLPHYVIGNERDEPNGTNTMYLSLYSPHDLLSAEVDGRPVGIEPQIELGSPVYSLLVSVPPQSTVTLRVTLGGVITGGGDYRLDVLNQPLANDDSFRMELRTPTDRPVAAPSGWRQVSNGTVSTERTLETDERFDVGFRSG